MIYLIEDRDYLKIGYTKNIVDRLTTFELHNCYTKLLTVKEGTLKDEEALHKLCKEYKYKREWFKNCPEVKKIFNDYQWDGEDYVKNWINYISIRANIIKENWKGYSVSLEGMKEVSKLDKQYKEYIQVKTKLALSELKMRSIIWEYYDMQNSYMHSSLMRPKPHIGDELKLYDDITITYGKEQ